MARVFRYYGKKRGHRRTDSSKLGRIVEAAFFAVLLLAGCGWGIKLFSTLVVPEWRVHHEFVETTCKILDKRIVEEKNQEGLLYAPRLQVEYTASCPISTVSQYDIHGAFFSKRSDAQAVLERFEVSSADRHRPYACWYDPIDPGRVVLARGYRWWTWVLLTVPLSLILIGAGGLVYTWLHWGKSAERRAVMARRTGELDLFGIVGNGEPSFPFVPRGADITNSPGTRLKYRLPMAGSPGWALFGLLAFCVAWNGTVAVFAVLAVGRHMAGRPDWFLTLFIIPFALVGLGAVAYFFRRLMLTAGVGPTRLEISAHPLKPAGHYCLFLSHAGRRKLHALRVWLACEESATYRQGTNSRTETREVFRQELFRREGVTEKDGLPLETMIDLCVPPSAMHSFVAEHNEVNWKLLIEGDVAGCPHYHRAFPVVVRPAEGESDR